MKNFFKKAPTGLDKDQAHLNYLEEGRRAWEIKLIEGRAAVRLAEAKMSEALASLEAIDQTINKVKDRIAAATIDYDSVGTLEMTTKISPVKYTEDEINQLANMSAVLKAQES